MALICWVLVMSPSLHAQTRWPVLQSSMYPYVDSMLLTRHEQTVLLGEGNQQTGIFFATLPESHSEQVHNELIGDALLKNWQVPLVGLVQWGEPWASAERRRDGLPWLGALQADQSSSGQASLDQSMALRSALDLALRCRLN